MIGKRLPVVLAVMILAAALLGLAGTALAGGPAAPSCAADIDYRIAPGAELTAVSCEIKDYKGEPSLWFHFTLKNTCTEPTRYRINVFLPNGKAVGGLVPRKGKPPVVAPGAEVKVKYPFKGVTAKPESLEIMVKAMGK